MLSNALRYQTQKTVGKSGWGGGEGMWYLSPQPHCSSYQQLQLWHRLKPTEKDRVERGRGSWREVGAFESVTFDLSNIAEAANTEPVVLALQSTSNAAPHTGLTHPRGPHQTQDLAVGAPSEPPHSYKLQDSVFHIL